MRPTDKLLGALRVLSARVGESETGLHARITSALLRADIAFRREVQLGVGRGRVDFLCSEPGIAIEAKIGYSSRARLAEQVRKYLTCPSVEGLVIVSERRVPSDTAEPAYRYATEAGKPLWIIELACGVAP